MSLMRGQSRSVVDVVLYRFVCLLVFFFLSFLFFAVLCVNYVDTGGALYTRPRSICFGSPIQLFIIHQHSARV